LYQTGTITNMAKRLIYHICRRQDWQSAEKTGLYDGGIDNWTDEFIHFSTAQQVAESAGRHYSKVAGLVLIAVNADDLGPTLKWESSRGGQFFPHLYGPLLTVKVQSVCDLPLREDGFHQFPDNIVPCRLAGGMGRNV